MWLSNTLYCSKIDNLNLHHLIFVCPSVLSASRAWLSYLASCPFRSTVYQISSHWTVREKVCGTSRALSRRDVNTDNALDCKSQTNICIMTLSLCQIPAWGNRKLLNKTWPSWGDDCSHQPHFSFQEVSLRLLVITAFILVTKIKNIQVNRTPHYDIHVGEK